MPRTLRRQNSSGSSSSYPATQLGTTIDRCRPPPKKIEGEDSAEKKIAPLPASHLLILFTAVNPESTATGWVIKDGETDRVILAGGERVDGPSRCEAEYQALLDGVDKCARLCHMPHVLAFSGSDVVIAQWRGKVEVPF